MIGYCIKEELPKGRMKRNDILKHYRDHCQGYWRKVLRYYESLPDLEKVIDEAGKFHKDSDHCDFHQRRIQRKAKEIFANSLKENKEELQKCRDFSTLYECLTKKCKSFGIGELAIYDTTMRIGAFLEKKQGGTYKPTLVYLHNGAMVGAEKMHSQKKISKPSPRMELSTFAHLFPGKDAYEIEEILCIYKSKF